jgi:predicted phosphodiesterase
MRRLNQRQIRNTTTVFWMTVVLSCVSRTSPEGRVAESLALSVPATFSLVSTDPTKFTFAAVGDLHIGSGNTDRLRTILNKATTDGDEFMVFLGDNVDQGDLSDVQAFRQAIHDTGWDGKTFSIAGNHDVFHDGWTHYKALTGSSTYTFTAGNSKFIAVDTADATLGSRQTTWLRGQLANVTASHVFILSHYLPIIPGVETWLKFSSDTEAADVMSLSKRSNVTAWIGGHYHSYIDQNIDGVEYLVAGGGGGRRMEPVKDYFFARVSIDGAAVTYQMVRVD